MDFVYKRLDISTIEDQVRVYIEAFGYEDTSFDEMLEHWKKKHYENPLGESFIFGAFDGDKLVGENCFLRMKYQYDGKELNLLQSCESGVLNSHQRKGIWGKLMRYAISCIEEDDTIEAIIGFPNYTNSYPGFQKMGWKTLFNEKNMLLPLNGKHMAEMYVGNHWWTGVFVLLNILQVRLNSINTKGYSVEEVTGELPEVAQIKAADADISIQFDTQWINWKSEYEQLKAYRVLHDEREMLVLSKEEQLEGQTYIKLIACLGTENENEKKKAVASVVRFVKSNRYAFVRGWEKQAGLFAGLGFIEMKKHVNPFIIHITKEENSFMENPDMWNPDFFDLD